MDPNVPAGAAVLLDFIGKAETARDGEAAYNTIIGHKEGKLDKPLTSHTLDELTAEQSRWVKNWKVSSGAAGRYQIIRKTLLGLMLELGLRGTQHFDANLQDRLGYHLLKTRGYDAFAAGRTTRETFALSLAKEWASMPVLAEVQGASRKLHRGQSYYAGDGINGALVSAEQLEAILDRAREARTAPSAVPGTIPPAQPSLPATGQETGFAALFRAIIGAIAAIFRRRTP